MQPWKGDATPANRPATKNATEMAAQIPKAFWTDTGKEEPAQGRQGCERVQRALVGPIGLWARPTVHAWEKHGVEPKKLMGCVWAHRTNVDWDGGDYTHSQSSRRKAGGRGDEWRAHGHRKRDPGNRRGLTARITAGATCTSTSLAGDKLGTAKRTRATEGNNRST